MTTASIAASADQPILLISDLHLASQRPATIELALQYLNQAQGASALFILGDLFEYWLGDDTADSALTPFIKKLHALSETGTAVYLMHGNRDFLIGEQFAASVGATLIRDDEAVFSFNGQTALLMHGDTLCTDDEGYQELRTQLRSSKWQTEFLSKTIDERNDIADTLRQQSIEATASKDTTIMDVNTDAFSAAFTKHNPALVIHGHTHQPQDHGGAQRRMVLGDWHEDHAMVARFDGEQFELMRFERS